MDFQDNNIIISSSELDSKLLEVIKNNFISVDIFTKLECLHNITYYLKPVFMLPQFRNWAISPDFNII